jgi:short-subunit dehydrogenase involved in D-alanine esterification of teichoic acids
MASGDHDDYTLKDYKYRYQPDLLQGKVAFITGGGSGIGFRITELLMRHGCDTVIASRRLSKVEEVCMFALIGTFHDILERVINFEFLCSLQKS